MRKSQKRFLRTEHLESRLMLTANVDLPQPEVAKVEMSESSFVDGEFSALGRLHVGDVDGTESFSGQLNRRQRSDVYQFSIDQSGDTTIQLGGLSSDLDLYLRNSNGTVIERSLNAGRRSESIVTELEPGDYELTVRKFRWRSASRYDLSITHQPHESVAPEDLAGNSRETAHDLGKLRGTHAFTESITSGDRSDYFRFELDSSSRVRIGLEDLSSDLDLCLYDADGRALVRSLKANDLAESIDTRLDSGTYYVSVVGYGNAVSDYSLTLETTTSQMPPATPDLESPPTPGEEQPVVDPPVTDTPADSTPTAPPVLFPDVPYYGSTRTDWNLNVINAPESWAQGITGEGVTVAVVDSGVDWDHVDLAGSIWSNSGEIAGDGIDNDGNGYVDDIRGWDFVYNDANPDDVNGHGTHVAGTIAAAMNSIGATGVAHDATIMPVRVLGDSGSGGTLGVANGIRYAVDNGADVINLSLGGGYSSAILSALQYADRNGVFVVAASGNDGASVASYPALHSSGLSNVISVGAHNSTDRIAGFSNDDGGRAVQVDAPGVSIYSTLPNNRYGNYSGTSMAAPHVAGLAALLVSANPSISNAEIRNAITGGAERTIAGSDSGGIVASSSLERITVTRSGTNTVQSVTNNSSSTNSGGRLASGRIRFVATGISPAVFQ
ncbi:MAG: S8 family serine peptidase, partial [Planctomycetota bacterium]